MQALVPGGRVVDGDDAEAWARERMSGVGAPKAEAELVRHACSFLHVHQHKDRPQISKSTHAFPRTSVTSSKTITHDSPTFRRLLNAPAFPR